MVEWFPLPIPPYVRTKLTDEAVSFDELAEEREATPLKNQSVSSPT